MLPVRLLIYQAHVFVVVDSCEPVDDRLQLDAASQRHRRRLLHRRRYVNRSRCPAGRGRRRRERLPALVPAPGRGPYRPDGQHHAVRLRPRCRAVVDGRTAVGVGVGGGREATAVLPGARVHRRRRAQSGRAAVSSRSTTNSSPLSVPRPRRHSSLQRSAARHDRLDVDARSETLLHTQNARQVLA